MNETIVIIEDEKDIADLIAMNLENNKYKTVKYNEGKKFLNDLNRGLLNIIDLIMLDLMLPDIDGIDICKMIRSNIKYKNIPILMLTAKNEESDKVIGLEMGADDYMVKPFSNKELIARIKALIRRSTINEETKSGDSEIIDIDGKIFMDLINYEVYDINKNKIVLTQTEFNLLKIFSSKRGRVFSREQLLNNLWGSEKYVIDRTIDVHIKNLREKLGETGNLIKNVRGVGYKLENKK